MLNLNINASDLSWFGAALVIVGIITLLVIKKYFETKISNVAKYEDIEKVTSTVESIRTEFHLSAQNKLNLANEERTALINYYEHFFHWITSLTTVSFSGFLSSNDDYLERIGDNIDRAKTEFDFAKAKVDIFVKDDKLDALHSEIISKAIKMHHFASTSVGSAIGSRRAMKLAMEKMQECAVNSNDNNNNLVIADLAQQEELLKQKKDLFDYFKNEHDKFQGELNDTASEYYSEIVRMYKEIVPHSKVLKETIYEHLKSMVE